MHRQFRDTHHRPAAGPDYPREIRKPRHWSRLERERRRVAIVGGGFGGLYAATALRRTDVALTLIDKRNFHLFQPLLYQVATGGLSPANIAAPLRALLARQRNARVLLGEVTDIDINAGELVLRNGRVAYDTLLLAAGSDTSYFGHDDWREHAPGLKSIEEATDIRTRILIAFERAERARDLNRLESLLTFVVIGGGPTGVEMAGAIAEIAGATLRDNFRHIEPSRARVILAEGEDRLLPTYTPDLSESAKRQLAQLGVNVFTGTFATSVEPGRVRFKTGNDQWEIGADTIVWGAGITASPLGKRLADLAGCETDKGGRVIVNPDLTIPGHPEIFVIGDLAHCEDQHGEPLPGLAPVAMQQAKYAAGLIAARLEGRKMPPFSYHDRGKMATIGRAAAVADIRGWRFGGHPAWLAWLFVHLLFLVQFQNRLLVLLQWAWNYITRGRTARLITGRSATVEPQLDNLPEVPATAEERETVDV